MKKNYRNLHEFIEHLEYEGELIRFSSPVSPELEITEITDRMSKLPGGGKAILFENIPGYEYPVLMNQFGSMKRICMALGCDSLDSLSGRLHSILNIRQPESLLEKLMLLPELVKYSKFLPKKTSNGKAPCQEVIHAGNDVDLSKLPVLKCWPDDGGRFFTLPVVFTKSLKDGRRNAGMYRMQIFDKNTTGMHWHIHKDGAHYYNEYMGAGKRMEVAVAVGTDPAVTYAATAPLPRGIDEMLLAGFIRRKPVVMVKCLTVDIDVPADAEFILEGYVDPDELRTEGPFGDHTGYYSLKGEYPVFHITAITHRRNPVYSATIVGKPPMEDCYMALATERIFLPMLRTILPEITDYFLPWEGVFHNIAVVAIEKEYPGHAIKVMNALWGSGQMSFAKILVIIDNPCLLTDRNALIMHILDIIEPGSDLVHVSGILDVLDHSAVNPLYGSKLGIDATSRIEGETAKIITRNNSILSAVKIAGMLESLDKDISRVKLLFEGSRNRVIIVSVKKTKRKNSLYYKKKITSKPALAGQGIYILYDSDINISDNSILLWKLFNNVDPARDLTINNAYILIDATRKSMEDGHDREWPDDIEMTSDIRLKIDRLLAGNPDFLNE